MLKKKTEGAICYTLNETLDDRIIIVMGHENWFPRSCGLFYVGICEAASLRLQTREMNDLKVNISCVIVDIQPI